MSPPNYILLDDAGGKFVLEGDQIKTAGPLDYEAQSSYQVTIGVEGATPAILPQTLTINVGDVFETSNMHLTGNSVSEAAEIGDFVGILSITNVQSGSPVFSLIDSAGGKFVIASDGVTIEVADVLDYETADSHTISVAVSGVVPPSAITDFTINVLSIGPYPIAFSPAHGATGVAQTVQPTVTFSVPARRASGYLYLKKVSDNTIVEVWAVTGNSTIPGAVELVGTVSEGYYHPSDPGGTVANQFSNTMVLHTTANLSGQTEYCVTWDAEIVRNIDNNFNPPFDGSTWHFTTGGTAPATITLSNALVLTTITNGTLIGELSVVGGSGTYTYTIPIDGDLDELFCLTGEDLGKRGAIGTGTKRITIRATNNVDAPIYQTFLITVVATDIIPTNSVAPVVSATSAISGDLLTCTTGTWDNRPVSYAYQWMRGGVDIGGATSSSYVMVAADVSTTVTCKVRSTNTAGTSAYTTSSNSCAVGAGGVLDGYTVGLAYSLRKVVAAYAGNCIRIKRSVPDTTEQDFGFVSGVVDAAGINTFVGAGDADIVKIYDQSGNGVDVSYEPGYSPSKAYWVASGLNGKPAIRFTTNTNLNSSAIEASVFSGANQITVVYVGDQAVSTAPFRWVNVGSSIQLFIATFNTQWAWMFGSGVAGIGGGCVLGTIPSTFYTGGHILEMYRSPGGEQGIIADGVSLVTGTGLDDVPSAGPAVFTLGYGFDGDISEFFILKTDIGATARAAVRSNLGGYYATTVTAPAPVTSLRYSGTDANATLTSTYGVVPAQFNFLQWHKFNSCTNFTNRSAGSGTLFTYFSLTNSGPITGAFGSYNATRLIPTADLGSHAVAFANATSIYKTVVPWRMSVIAKAAGYNRMVLHWKTHTDASPGPSAISIGFDLVGGNVGYDNVVGADIVLDAATMTSIGSGWWLCKIDFHYPTSSESAFGIVQPQIFADNGTGTAARSTSFTGDGTSGIDIMWWHLLPKACWTINWSELFYEDFDNLDMVDWENTKEVGYKFYINNKFLSSAQPDFWLAGIPSSDPRWFSIDRPSIMKMYSYLQGTINEFGVGSAGWDLQLWTVVDQGGGTTHASFKHKPPLVFERYADWDTRIIARAQNWSGNINLWSLDYEMLDNNLGYAVPPATVANYHIEWDIVETVANTSGGTVHGWGYPYDVYHSVAGGTAGIGPFSAGELPLKSFTRHGSIWLRAEDTGTAYGTVMFFINGWGVAQSFYGPTVLPIPTPSGPTGIGAFTGSDNHHMVLISNGTGNSGEYNNPGQPYYVDWFRVYGVAP